ATAGRMLLCLPTRIRRQANPPAACGSAWRVSAVAVDQSPSRVASDTRPAKRLLIDRGRLLNPWMDTALIQHRVTDVVGVFGVLIRSAREDRREAWARVEQS